MKKQLMSFCLVFFIVQPHAISAELDPKTTALMNLGGFFGGSLATYCTFSNLNLNPKIAILGGIGMFALGGVTKKFFPDTLIEKNLEYLPPLLFSTGVGVTFGGFMSRLENAMHWTSFSAINDYQTVERLLHSGVNVNAINNTGETALMRAISSGHTNIMQLLLDAGADVNAADNAGRSAFNEAYRYKREDIMELLIQNGAHGNSANGEVTALMWASSRGRADMVQLLLTAGADVNAINNAGRSAFNEAYGNNREDIMELLIQKGAHGNSANGEVTALMWASSRGRTDMVQQLLTAGADVNIVSFQGNTALIRAAVGKHTEIVQLLLAAGADVNAINNAGRSALHYALDAYFEDSANVDILRPFIEKGVHIPSHIVNGTTLLHRAYTLGDSQTVNLLLEQGADVNIPDQEYGATLLHIACSRGDDHTVRLLLDHGASVSAIDADGKSPEDDARERNWPEITNLLAAKANIEKECKVCLDSCKVRDFVRLHCGHDDTCRSCMLKIINSSLRQRSLDQLMCTDPQCQDKHFTEADHRSISGYPNIKLYKEQQEEINDIRTYEWIRSQPNAKQCTTPDCPFLFLANDNPELVRCEKCKKEYCSHCMHPHANNWTCAHAKAVREAENPEAAATARLIAEITKPCPGCNANVERSGGCNHIICGTHGCDVHFCVNCGKKLEVPYYNSTALDGTLLCGCPTWPQKPASSS